MQSLWCRLVRLDFAFLSKIYLECKVHEEWKRNSEEFRHWWEGHKEAATKTLRILSCRESERALKIFYINLRSLSSVIQPYDVHILNLFSLPFISLLLVVLFGKITLLLGLVMSELCPHSSRCLHSILKSVNRLVPCSQAPPDVPYTFMLDGDIVSMLLVIKVGRGRRISSTLVDQEIAVPLVIAPPSLPPSLPPPIPHFLFLLFFLSFVSD